MTWLIVIAAGLWIAYESGWLTNAINSVPLLSGTIPTGSGGTGGPIDSSERIPTSSGWLDNLGGLWDSSTGGNQTGTVSDPPRPGGGSQIDTWGGDQQ
jgi:hypothetical protein